MASNLAVYVNSQPQMALETPDRDRASLVGAVQLLREMNRLKKSVKHAYGDNAPAGKALREAWQKLQRILDSLAPLKWEILPFGLGYVVEPDAPTPLERAFLLLSEVTLAGLLDRVRECKKCSKWFAARRQGKVFCSADCQATYWEDYRKTPAGKREQAKRMARWRKSVSKSTARTKRRAKR